MNKRSNTGTFLYDPIKDFIKINCFKNEINNHHSAKYNGGLISYFNHKYNIYISGNQPLINIIDQKIGNEGLIELSKIEFKEMTDRSTRRRSLP